MNTQKGQVPAEDKDKNNNLFGLTLTKEELEALRFAMQMDYGILQELSSHDLEWGHKQAIAGSVLYKISRLDEATGYRRVSEDTNE